MTNAYLMNLEFCTTHQSLFARVAEPQGGYPYNSLRFNSIKLN
jgi:hypothetical protein